MAKKTYSKSTSKSEKPKGLPALQLLGNPSQYVNRDKSIPLIVLFGDEPYLQQKAIQMLETAFNEPGEEEIELKRFGQDAPWSEINEELSLVSMFGPQRRLALVEQADKFVTDNRERLEAYCDSANPLGTLILTVSSFPANTNLYKKTESTGLAVNCCVLDVGALDKWLYQLSTEQYQAKIDRDAISFLIDRVGNSMGLLEQEIVKLVSYANGKSINRGMIEQLAGTTQMRTAWDMLDYALAGNLDLALRNLDALMMAGDHPVMIIAQLAVKLRKIAMAQRLVRDAQLTRTPLQFSEALKLAGQGYYVDKIAQQYQFLGQERTSELLRWLEELDFAVKGDSRLDLKLLMEQFLIRLAAK